jgi:hypothetical protein
LDLLNTAHAEAAGPPYGWEVVLRFGRHRGRSIGQVAQSDPSYLEWCVREMQRLDDTTRVAIESVLSWIRERRRES